MGAAAGLREARRTWAGRWRALARRFRIWPQSLVRQVIALMLLSIIVVQIITLWLAFDERRSALQTAGRDQVLERTVALVRTLENAPAEARPFLLQATGTPRLHFVITSAPMARPEKQGRLATNASRILNEMLGNRREAYFQVRDIAELLAVGEDVGMALPPDLAARPDQMSAELPPGQALPRPPAPPTTWDEIWPQLVTGFGLLGPPHYPAGALLMIAVKVKTLPGETDQWLNVRAVLPPPPALAKATLNSTFFMGVAVLLVALFMATHITRTLRGLAEAADRLGRGAEVGELKEAGPREVRQVIHAFNAMQKRLDRFVSDRMRMLAAISHDLRTPLTAMRLRVEFVDDDEIREKLVEGIEEMTAMAQGVLDFMRESHSGDSARTYQLLALVEAVADDFIDLGKPVKAGGNPNVQHLVRPNAFKRALRNLIENAVRYGGSAEVQVVEDNQTIVVCVRDHGPGIPADRLREVFEPFVRLEASRNQETGGVGLGLSITRTIVHQHGGELVLANHPEGGLEARIILPR